MVLDAMKTNGARRFIMAAFATLLALSAAMTMGGGWASAQTGSDGTAPEDPTATVEPTVEATVEPTAVPGDDEPERDGQLVRRGLFGKAVRVGGDSFLVETRHGNVLVLVNDDTVIRKPPEGIVGLDALEVGDKVAVLLVKPTEEEAAQAPASEIFRTGTALKVLIVPDRATRRHTRAVVLEKLRDRVRFIDRDGVEREIETDVEIEGEAGDELLLVTQDSADGLRERVRNSARAEVIEDRLARIAETRADVRERVEEARLRVEEARVEARDRVNERLANADVQVSADVRLRIEQNTEAIRERVQARVEEVRSNAEDRREEIKDNAQDRREEVKDEVEDRVEQARETAQEAKERIQATAEARRRDAASAGDDSARDATVTVEPATNVRQ